METVEEPQDEGWTAFELACSDPRMRRQEARRISNRVLQEDEEALALQSDG